MKKLTKVPVSSRALIQRVNRRLVREQQHMMTLPVGSRWSNEMGRYYIVDRMLNTIIAQRCDLEKVAKELGVLKPYEEFRD